MLDRSTWAFLAVVAVVGGAVLVVEFGGLSAVVDPGEYEGTRVDLEDADGTHLATIDVRIADTFDKRYTGLSNTSSLGPREGMLFVYEQSGRHAYVMRRMAFPLDIVYVASNGTVTAIHHAPVPENTPGEELRRYPGRGQYVLEVNRGVTNETGLDVGDTVVVPESVHATSTPTPA